MSIIQSKIVKFITKIVKFNRKWSNLVEKDGFLNKIDKFLIKFDHFRLNSTIFDINLKLDSNSDRDFESSRRFRCMPGLNSDLKTSIKVDSNTIQIEFPGDLNLIALADFLVGGREQKPFQGLFTPIKYGSPNLYHVH